MHPTRTAIDHAARSLTELAELARGGDHEAFRHIMQRCNQRLFRVARAMLNDEDEAEDALQDAYVQAFRHLDGFRGEAELTTWLTRIVINECRQKLRARRENVSIEDLDMDHSESNVLPFPQQPGMDTPMDAATRAEMRRLVERAVSELAEPFRVVFMLRDVEEYSVEETAELLGIRPETVKTRLFRARRHLRDALQETVNASLGDAFSFLGSRCARLTDAVLSRLIPVQAPRA